MAHINYRHVHTRNDSSASIRSKNNNADDEQTTAFKHWLLRIPLDKFVYLTF